MLFFVTVDDILVKYLATQTRRYVDQGIDNTHRPGKSTAPELTIQYYHLFPLPCGAGSTVPHEGFDSSVIMPFPGVLWL